MSEEDEEARRRETLSKLRALDANSRMHAPAKPLSRKAKVHVRRLLIQRDGPNCRYCGEPPQKVGRMTIDHVWPRSKGGSNKLKNLVLACKPCNAKKAHSTPGRTPPLTKEKHEPLSDPNSGR